MEVLLYAHAHVYEHITRTAFGQRFPETPAPSRESRAPSL